MTGQISELRGLLGVRERQTVQDNPRQSAVQLFLMFLAALAFLTVPNCRES
jgi:hypothetical protein